MPAGNAPLIHLSFGTVAGFDRYRAAIESPQLQVMPHAAAMVCHGGAGFGSPVGRSPHRSSLDGMAVPDAALVGQTQTASLTPPRTAV